MHFNFFFDWNIKVIILKITAVIDLATPVVTGGNGKYLLNNSAPRVRFETYFFLLLSEMQQKRSNVCILYVYSAAKQILGWEDLSPHYVLIKEDSSQEGFLPR